MDHILAACIGATIVFGSFLLAEKYDKEMYAPVLKSDGVWYINKEKYKQHLKKYAKTMRKTKSKTIKN